MTRENKRIKLNAEVEVTPRLQWVQEGSYVEPCISLKDLVPLRMRASDWQLVEQMNNYYVGTDFSSMSEEEVVNTLYYTLSKIPGDKVYKLVLSGLLGLDIENKEFAEMLLNKLHKINFKNGEITR